MNEFVVVKDEAKQEEDIVLTINDNYDNMDICEYIMPVPETEILDYIVVKEQPKVDEFHIIDYAL